MTKLVSAHPWLPVISAAILVFGFSLWLPGDQARVQAQDSGIFLGENSLRALTVGPLSLTAGDSAHTSLMIPAVQGSVTKIWILNGAGELMFTRDFPGPVGQRVQTRPVIQDFINVSFDLAVDGTGDVTYSDGALFESIGALDQTDSISILVSIALPNIRSVGQPALRSSWGTLELTSRTLYHPFIVSFVPVQ